MGVEVLAFLGGGRLGETWLVRTQAGALAAAKRLRQPGASEAEALRQLSGIREPELVAVLGAAALRREGVGAQRALRGRDPAPASRRGQPERGAVGAGRPVDPRRPRRASPPRTGARRPSPRQRARRGGRSGAARRRGSDRAGAVTRLARRAAAWRPVGCLDPAPHRRDGRRPASGVACRAGRPARRGSTGRGRAGRGACAHRRRGRAGWRRRLELEPRHSSPRWSNPCVVVGAPSLRTAPLRNR